MHTGRKNEVSDWLLGVTQDETANPSVDSRIWQVPGVGKNTRQMTRVVRDCTKEKLGFVVNMVCSWIWLKAGLQQASNIWVTSAFR